MNNLLIKYNRYNDWEQLINKDTGEILCEGHKLDAEDVLFALDYRFEIEEDYEDEDI